MIRAFTIYFESKFYMGLFLLHLQVQALSAALPGGISLLGVSLALMHANLISDLRPKAFVETCLSRCGPTKLPRCRVGACYYSGKCTACVGPRPCLASSSYALTPLRYVYLLCARLHGCDAFFDEFVSGILIEGVLRQCPGVLCINTALRLYCMHR
jgi:hypothetical protein